MKRYSCDLPLHSGRAPRWLFSRMVKLAREISVCMVGEYGPDEVLRRLTDPFWFQAFGCVLGFDWHSSGVTTTVCGALKQGLKDIGHELGIYVAGGKGGRSRRAPEEIDRISMKAGTDGESLIYSSRMSAKVDSAALQDGFQVYQHTFFFTRTGLWAVVQQGMNDSTGMARRYHWLSHQGLDYVCEPHRAVCCNQRGKVLNMVARESDKIRHASASIASRKPEEVLNEVKRIHIADFPERHLIEANDIDPEKLKKVLLKTYEQGPGDFEELLAVRGVGPRTIRSLSLISELLYGSRASVRDPARFSFAHGGKDGIPYPVDRETYDRTIDILQSMVSRAQLDRSEKKSALHRLHERFDQG